MEFSLLPLIAFAFAASVTPGPNNALVTANAAANGWRATWPHILGNGAGFSLMIVLVGAGLAGVLAAQPLLAAAMRWGAMAWLVWLAFKIATGPVDAAAGGGMRFGFVKAVLFQWVNPKAWLLALSIAAAWVRPDEAALPQLLVIGRCFPWSRHRRAFRGRCWARVLRGCWARGGGCGCSISPWRSCWWCRCCRWCWKAEAAGGRMALQPRGRADDDRLERYWHA